MKTPKTAKPVKASILIARLPDDLMKKIDATAKKCGRTRSSETRMRLEESLKRMPVMAVSGAIATAQQ